jgi:hypothetical protein
MYDRVIDRRTYERQRDRLRERLTLAEIAAAEAVTEAIDIEGVLTFAKRALSEAARFWELGNVAQRRTLQGALLPEGLTFDGKEFGTAVTCMAFMQMAASCDPESRMASPTGFEPVVAEAVARPCAPCPLTHGSRPS